MRSAVARPFAWAALLLAGCALGSHAAAWVAEPHVALGFEADAEQPAKTEPPAQKNPPAAGPEPQPAEPAKEPEKPKSTEDLREEEKEKIRQRWFSVHWQGTVITQIHDDFPSPYVGPKSLLPREPAATTETATVFLDVKTWEGGEVVFDPEISGGKGFSGTAGVAGFLNGEATRVGDPQPTPYIARLFFRQTWNLGGPWERVEDAPNQMAGRRDLNHVTLSVGKMSAEDVADDNRFSHDPRTQFLDWALMYTGAWDYPANVRGYTYGVALDFSTVYWALHYGIFAEPSEANGAALDPHFLKANGQVLEIEERYTLGDRPGKLREWVYLNHAHMGNYRLALAEMPVNPDITLTRSYRFKYGIGGNWEQELTRDLGVFARAGWNDGQSESWAFTEIDSTAALGLQLKGRLWCRPQDRVGLAGVVNGLSSAHGDYLAAGGIGFIIGDGRLRYGPEEIVETYYDWEVRKGISLTLDFQEVNHPAYNRDRGPVSAGSARVHFEY